MDEQAFKGHGLWPTVTALETLLGQAEERGDVSAATSLATLRYIFATVQAHAEPSDTAPYSNHGLTSIQQSFNNLQGELAAYVSNGNVGHLNNAMQHADAALYQVGLLPTAQLKGGAAAQANKLFKEYRETAEQAIATLQESNAELRQQLTEQTAASNASVASLKEQVAALATKVTQDEARLDTALTTNNDAFTAKQTEREERFTTWLTEQGEALKKLAGGDLEAIKAARVASDAAFNEVDKLRDDTKAVAALATGDQVARGYRSFSARQFGWGIASYLVGFAALATGIWLVVQAVADIKPTDDVSWQFTAVKLGLTATAVFAAVVAFRLGSHLLSEASTAKRFELELKAVGPLFPTEEEQETLRAVKKDLIERSFGQGWRTSEDSKQVMDEKWIERVADVVARRLNP